MAAASPVVPGQLSQVSACGQRGLGTATRSQRRATLSGSWALDWPSSLSGSVLWEPAFLVKLLLPTLKPDSYL